MQWGIAMDPPSLGTLSGIGGLPRIRGGVTGDLTSLNEMQRNQPRIGGGVTGDLTPLKEIQRNQPWL